MNVVDIRRVRIDWIENAGEKVPSPADKQLFVDMRGRIGVKMLLRDSFAIDECSG